MNTASLAVPLKCIMCQIICYYISWYLPTDVISLLSSRYGHPVYLLKYFEEKFICTRKKWKKKVGKRQKEINKENKMGKRWRKLKLIAIESPPCYLPPSRPLSYLPVKALTDSDGPWTVPRTLDPTHSHFSLSISLLSLFLSLPPTSFSFSHLALTAHSLSPQHDMNIRVTEWDWCPSTCLARTRYPSTRERSTEPGPQIPAPLLLPLPHLHGRQDDNSMRRKQYDGDDNNYDIDYSVLVTAAIIIVRHIHCCFARLQCDRYNEPPQVTHSACTAYTAV